MSAGAPNSAEFETLIEGSGNKAGIEVPASVIDRLGAGRRPAVHIDVNGFEYRSTVAVMGGRYLIGVSAQVRKASGLQAGDRIRVKLTVADTPRAVDIPADFAAALDAHPGSRGFFDGLSNSLQRYHVDLVNGAKADETRQRRITKAIELFLAGKPR
ncbi:MAG TPA: YdeI/OmpD-associated family protein [Ilumatobacteraceae bacterium]|nr:YdeI/OmpD-associated family protein [Ilumatobacteraceae bacterium]